MPAMKSKYPFMTMKKGGKAVIPLSLDVTASTVRSAVTHAAQKTGRKFVTKQQEDNSFLVVRRVA